MTNKKILLINPPFARIVGLEQNYVPLALLHISTILKQQGFKPYIKNLNIDQGLSYVNYKDRNQRYDTLMALYNWQKEIYYKELDDTINTVKPDIVGFTILTPQIKIANDLIEHVTHCYGLPIFCGGAGATLNEDKIKGANLICQGGINDLLILNNINEYHNETYEELDFNLDDYNGELNFDHLLDTYSKEAYGHVYSSVGCYFNCRFCASPAIWHRKVYFKPMMSFIKELETIADRFEPDKFQIWDENFTANSKRMEEFFKLYKCEQLWNCDSRVNSLNEELIKKMKTHGCWEIAIGVESGCQKVLDYLNKGIKLDQIKQVVSLIHKYNIHAKIYMIIGFPEETEEQIFESLDFIKALEPDQVTLSLFTPYAHTELFLECKTKGLIDDSYDESEHSHQSDKFLRLIHPNINLNKIIKAVDRINKHDRG
jgi:anaerobic magnesium-protoporphyrin IX monomethyl ester cyclase